MNPALEKLHDIDGIDTISFFPLAIGWWFSCVFVFLLLCVFVFFTIRYVIYKRSWKNDTLKKLKRLEKDLRKENAQETAKRLSEYLKRVALRKYSRSECAHLTGEKWLKWLTAHDPKQYDWEKESHFLGDISYSPATAVISEENVKKAIQAAKQWVY